MVMLTKKFIGKKAFEDVIITGTVLGKDGKPMSKSRNNGVDPIEMFDKFGVDATRIYLASIATGADIKWNDVGVETYRNFANKIWNATRFCLMNSEGATVCQTAGGSGGLTQTDRRSTTATAGGSDLPTGGSISRLNKTAKAVNRALETYQFHEAVQLLYHFFWDDFCDWYIELKKDEINAGDIACQYRGSCRILEQALRLLHPFMPYLTEDLWQKLPGVSNAMHNAAYTFGRRRRSCLRTFQRAIHALIDEQAESEMSAVIELITKVRNIRSEMNIKPSDQRRRSMSRQTPRCSGSLPQTKPRSKSLHVLISLFLAIHSMCQRLRQRPF